MKIRNYSIEHLHNLLFNLPLRGKDSRMRTRFTKSLRGYLTETFMPEQNYLIKQYAKTDEEELIQEYQKEYTMLMNEFFHIEENEVNKTMLLTVAEIVLEGDFEVSGEMAEIYDKWCEEFEKVIKNYENSED